MEFFIYQRIEEFSNFGYCIFDIGNKMHEKINKPNYLGSSPEKFNTKYVCYSIN
jgi:hypothetical protein